MEWLDTVSEGWMAFDVSVSGLGGLGVARW